jgi:uncharacterized delta-60 repeat protein
LRARTRIASALAVLVALAVPGAAVAAPGDLDPSFGTGGKFTLAVGPHASGINAAVRQPDGKIVVAGFAEQSPSAPFNRDFLVARLNENGTLDSSFNPSGAQPGVRATAVGAGTANDTANAVALGPNGTIYAAGITDDIGGGDVAVVRYTSQGVEDSGFSSDGIQILTGANQEYANGIAVQSGDGKPILVGYAGTGFYVLRLDPTTGALDTTYNAGGATPGTQTVAFGGAAADQAFAVALQPDGKAVVAGGADSASVNSDVALARLDVNGMLDTAGFGSGTGKVQTPLPNAELAFSISLDNGKIVVGGTSVDSSSSQFLVNRYLGDGSPDPAFSDDGIQLTPFVAADGAKRAAAQSVVVAGGEILASGWAATCNGSDCDDFAFARYIDDGKLDPSFGSGGMKTHPIGSQNDFALGAVAGASTALGRCDVNGVAQLCGASIDNSAGGGTPPPPLVTSIRTILSSGFKAGQSIEITQGDAVFDSAVIEGDNAASAGGTVTFTLYDGATCETTRDTGRINEVDAPIVNGGTEAPVALAIRGTSLEPGVYSVLAEYSGDAHNLSTVSCDEHISVRGPQCPDTAEEPPSLCAPPLAVFRDLAAWDREFSDVAIEATNGKLHGPKLNNAIKDLEHRKDAFAKRWFADGEAYKAPLVDVFKQVDCADRSIARAEAYARDAQIVPKGTVAYLTFKHSIRPKLNDATTCLSDLRALLERKGTPPPALLKSLHDLALRLHRADIEDLDGSLLKTIRKIRVDKEALVKARFPASLYRLTYLSQLLQGAGQHVSNSAEPNDHHQKRVIAHEAVSNIVIAQHFKQNLESTLYSGAGPTSSDGVPLAQFKELFVWDKEFTDVAVEASGGRLSDSKLRDAIRDLEKKKEKFAKDLFANGSVFGGPLHDAFQFVDSADGWIADAEALTEDAYRSSAGDRGRLAFKGRTKRSLKHAAKDVHNFIEWLQVGKKAPAALTAGLQDIEKRLRRLARRPRADFTFLKAIRAVRVAKEELVQKHFPRSLYRLAYIGQLLNGASQHMSDHIEVHDPARKRSTEQAAIEKIVPAMGFKQNLEASLYDAAKRP